MRLSEIKITKCLTQENSELLSNKSKFEETIIKLMINQDQNNEYNLKEFWAFNENILNKNSKITAIGYWQNDIEKNNKKWFEIKICKTKWKGENAFILSFADIYHYIEIDEYKNKFFLNFCAQLYSPISNIQGNLEKLLKEKIEKEAKRRIKKAILALTILQNTVKNFNDFSLLCEGKFHLNIENISLTKFMKDLEKTFKKQAQLKNIFCCFKYDFDNSLEISNDPERLKQVLLAIFSNVMKNTENTTIYFHGKITNIFEIKKFNENFNKNTIKMQEITKENEIVLQKENSKNNDWLKLEENQVDEKNENNEEDKNDLKISFLVEETGSWNQIEDQYNIFKI